MELRRHNVVLRDGPIVLRPMCERDWPDLLRWNRDTDVLRFVEADPKARYDLASTQVQYREVSRSAHCFVIKYGRAIGWCWLQQMNLSRILERFPDRDCRRIDLAIGEPGMWGRGIGTAAIGLLTAFAWRDGAASVFGCDIAGFNQRSIRAFARCGYVEFARAADGEAGERIDMAVHALQP
jgi:RimJ/RimL family protein N-acetyltransferase